MHVAYNLVTYNCTKSVTLKKYRLVVGTRYIVSSFHHASRHSSILRLSSGHWMNWTQTCMHPIVNMLFTGLQILASPCNVAKQILIRGYDKLLWVRDCECNFPLQRAVLKEKFSTAEFLLRNMKGVSVLLHAFVLSAPRCG